MKKIFWTTIFWVLIIFLFRFYSRVLHQSLGKEVGSRFGTPQQICLTGEVTTWVNQQLDAIQVQLDAINQKLQSPPESPIQPSVFQTTDPTKVALYYFNQTEDQKLNPEQQINIDSILPVYRIFPASKNLLVDTLHELLKGNLTTNEKQQGFVTDFPNNKFALVSSDFASDGTLTLQFTEVSWFTDGWSARMLILSNLIKKTVLQFPAVKKIVFVPETLFQP